MVDVSGAGKVGKGGRILDMLWWTVCAAEGRKKLGKGSRFLGWATGKIELHIVRWEKFVGRAAGLGSTVPFGYIFNKSVDLLCKFIFWDKEY